MPKSKPGCYDFKAGKCTRGAGCRFSHEPDADYSAKSPDRKKSSGFVKQQPGTFERQLPDANQQLPEAFIEYYTAQGIIQPTELEAFSTSACSPLPVVFRVSKAYPQWQRTVTLLAANPNLQLLGWFPDQCAWQCTNEYFEEDAVWHKWIREANFHGDATHSILTLCTVTLSRSVHRYAVSPCALAELTRTCA